MYRIILSILISGISLASFGQTSKSIGLITSIETVGIKLAKFPNKKINSSNTFFNYGISGQVEFSKRSSLILGLTHSVREYNYHQIVTVGTLSGIKSLDFFTEATEKIVNLSIGYKYKFLRDTRVTPFFIVGLNSQLPYSVKGKQGNWHNPSSEYTISNSFDKKVTLDAFLSLGVDSKITNKIGLSLGVGYKAFIRSNYFSYYYVTNALFWRSITTGINLYYKI